MNVSSSITGAIGSLFSPVTNLFWGSKPTSPPRKIDVWSNTIGRNFFQYSSNRNNKTLSLYDKSGDVSKCAHYNECAKLFVSHNPASLSYPFLIVVGSIVEKCNDDGKKNDFFPFEFTPLYYGIPNISGKHVGDLTGGYLVPTLFNMVLSAKKLPIQTNPTPIKLSKSETEEISMVQKHLTVAEVAGISSSAVTQMYYIMLNGGSFGDMVDGLLGMIGMKMEPASMNYWSPMSGKNNTLKFVDGGACDNSAIVAQL